MVHIPDYSQEVDPRHGDFPQQGKISLSNLANQPSSYITMIQVKTDEMVAVYRPRTDSSSIKNGNLEVDLILSTPVTNMLKE